MSDRNQVQVVSGAVGRPVSPGRWTKPEVGTIVAAVLATSVAFIDATALNVAMPALQRDLHASGFELLWSINAYGVMVAALLLLGGAAGDRFGRRRTCQSGLLLFAFGSLACGLSVAARGLILARAAQGVGAALMIPSSLAIVAAGVAPERRGRAIGVWSALSVVITALGPVLGGLLVDAGMWRSVFFINLPLTVLALGALQAWVTESRDELAPEQVDWPGACLAALSLGFLSYGLILAGDVSGKQGQAVGSMFFAAVAFLAFLAFLAVESRSPHPLVPLHLFRDSPLGSVCCVNLLFFSSIYGMMFLFSLNLIDVQGYDSAAAGLAQLPLMTMVILLSGWSGAVCDRRGARMLLLGGMILASLGFLGLSFAGITAGRPAYWTAYLPWLLVLGTAMGLTIAPLSSTLMSAVVIGRAGLAAGINSTASRLSSVLGIALLGPVAMVTLREAISQRAAAASLDGDQCESLLAHASHLAPSAILAGQGLLDHLPSRQLLAQAFVDAFRTASWVSAAATSLAAIIVYRTVHSPGASPETDP